MALDPSISLGVRPPDIQIQSPMQAIGQALTLRNLMAQGQMQQMQMQQEQLQLDQAQRLAQQRRDFGAYLQSKAAPQTPAGTPGTAAAPAGELDRGEMMRLFPDIAPTILRHLGLEATEMDGRPLPANDPQPWWYGYSVGRWDGDTLVVQTTGLRDGGWLDIQGSPLTDQAKLTERIRRPNFGTLIVDVGYPRDPAQVVPVVGDA